jgi:RNA polymerase sigma-54 factor
MDLTLCPQMRPQQTLGVSPLLIASAQMLALASIDVADAVSRELDENPALELPECARCTTCGLPLARSRKCRHCLYDDGAGRDWRRVGDEVDWPAKLAEQVSEASRLLADLRLALPASEHQIAETLVGSLDDRGYLTAPTDAIAGWLGVKPAHVERVLAELRQTGPAGTGARDLRECLLLQLDRLAAHSRPADDELVLVRRVVAEHLPELAGGRFTAIAEALGVRREDVLRARELIRRRLRPSPGVDRRSGAPPRTPPPDVLVELQADELRVHLTEPEIFGVRVAPSYAALAGSARTAERDHAAPYARRAREFITRLEQRWETMRRVAVAAVGRQAEWVRAGSGPRRELTRAQIARSLSVHESTVSRAVRGRTMRLPGGRVADMSMLFASGDDAREQLRVLLASETEPLTDAQLARELAARGQVLARRTVAKYRAQLGQERHTLR